jgi:HSP20 family molecular chaperone IbpA
MAETKTSEQGSQQQSSSQQSPSQQPGSRQQAGSVQRTDTALAEESSRQSGSQQGERSMQARRTHGLLPRGAYPSLFAVSPFEMMRRMSEEMIRTLAGVPSPAADTPIWTPKIEARQEEGEFVIRAELAGLDAGDITVDVGDDAVTIHGERRAQHERRRGDLVVSEISYGEFHRAIPLPEGVIADNAVATFRDGVLEIRMPAPPSEVRRGRRLEINQGQSQSGNQSNEQTRAQNKDQSRSGSEAQGPQGKQGS